MTDNHDNNNNNHQLAVIAIISALALFGVVAITLVIIPLQMQEAEAAKSVTGPCASSLQNASARLCHTIP